MSDNTKPQHPFRVWRMMNGHTQAKAGEMLGISKQSVSQLERGELKCSRSLAVKAEEVTGGEVNRTMMLYPFGMNLEGSQEQIARVGEQLSQLPPGHVLLTAPIPAGLDTQIQRMLSWSTKSYSDILVEALQLYLGKAYSSEQVLTHPQTGDVVFKGAGQPFPEIPDGL